MKPLLALLGVTMGIVVAAPVHAEPGIDESPTSQSNETFLADLHKVGIGFGDPSPGDQRRPSGMRAYPQRHVRSSPDQAFTGEQPRPHRERRRPVRHDLGEGVLPKATRRICRAGRQGN